MPTPASRDRRVHPRTPADLGCKVLRPALARYLSARTADVSAGGALIDLQTTTPLQEGEHLDVGVGWTGSGVLRARDLVEAVVVRATPLLNNSQRVAVRFATAQAAAARLIHASASAA